MPVHSIITAPLVRVGVNVLTGMLISANGTYVVYKLVILNVDLYVVTARNFSPVLGSIGVVLAFNYSVIAGVSACAGIAAISERVLLRLTLFAAGAFFPVVGVIFLCAVFVSMIGISGIGSTLIATAARSKNAERGDKHHERKEETKNSLFHVFSPFLFSG
jgi:hypothetical protein